MDDGGVPTGTQVLIAGVRPPGGGAAQDVLVQAGRVAQVAPAGALTASGAQVVPGQGRFLIPGLWDEHTHMVQWALARQRLDLSQMTSAAQVANLVAGAVAGGDGDPVVGYGFRDALWPDTPSLDGLDAVSGSTPVILVSGDLHCGWVNSAGARLLGVRAEPHGLMREGDWFPAAARLDEVTIAGAEEALAKALPALPARGVVGVVDLEMGEVLSDWRRRINAGHTGLRVEAGIYPNRLDAAIEEGLRTGDLVPGCEGLLRVGPLKVMSDGSLNTRTAYCRHPYTDAGAGLAPTRADAGGYGHLEFSAEEMLAMVRRAHRAGIASTIHAIGDLAVSTALDVFAAAGVSGRIEHAQLVAGADVPRFAALGVSASVQPEHAMDDRDIVDRFWADRSGDSFPLARLHAAGAVLRLGSDAPVAPLDPWVAMAAAVGRVRDGRPAWHPEQRLDPQVALAASTQGRGQARTGDVADLVLVEQDPLSVDVQTLRQMPVSATMLAGRWTHGPA